MFYLLHFSPGPAGMWKRIIFYQLFEGFWLPQVRKWSRKNKILEGQGILFWVKENWDFEGKSWKIERDGINISGHCDLSDVFLLKAKARGRDFIWHFVFICSWKSWFLSGKSQGILKIDVCGNHGNVRAFGFFFSVTLAGTSCSLWVLFAWICAPFLIYRQVIVCGLLVINSFGEIARLHEQEDSRKRHKSWIMTIIGIYANQYHEGNKNIPKQMVKWA